LIFQLGIVCIKTLEVIKNLHPNILPVEPPFSFQTRKGSLHFLQLAQYASVAPSSGTNCLPHRHSFAFACSPGLNPFGVIFFVSKQTYSCSTSAIYLRNSAFSFVRRSLKVSLLEELYPSTSLLATSLSWRLALLASLSSSYADRFSIYLYASSIPHS